LKHEDYGPWDTICSNLLVLHNNLVDAIYSMLLGRLWLQDAKVSHDWGNNLVTIQGNGIVKKKTIKH
jgi:hypothetical protein